MQRRSFLGTVAAVVLAPLASVFAQKPKGVVIPVVMCHDMRPEHLEVTTKVPVWLGDYLYKAEDGLYWPVSSKDFTGMPERDRWLWYFANVVAYAAVTVGTPQQLQESLDRARKFYGRI